jgi:hypothetical protein
LFSVLRSVVGGDIERSVFVAVTQLKQGSVAIISYGQDRGHVGFVAGINSSGRIVCLVEIKVIWLNTLHSQIIVFISMFIQLVSPLLIILIH